GGGGAGGGGDGGGGGRGGGGGGGEGGAALERPDEYRGGLQREQHRQVGPGRENVRPRRHPLPHRDQVGLDVLVDQGDQVGVRDRDRGELKRGVELGQPALGQRVPAGHHGGLRGEVDRRVFQADL